MPQPSKSQNPNNPKSFQWLARKRLKNEDLVPENVPAKGRRWFGAVHDAHPNSEVPGGGREGGSRFHIWIEVQDLTNLLISSFSSKSSSSSPNGLYRVSATLGIKMESIFLLLTKMVFNAIYKYLFLVFYIIYIKVDSPQPAHIEQEFDGHEDWVVEVNLMKNRVFQSCC